MDLRRHWNHGLIWEKWKKHLYISLLRPIITCGAETWSLREKEERKQMIFERKILKKIFGPVVDEETGEWRVRKNNESEKLFQRQNIANTIRSRRLQWAGHAWPSQNPLLHVVMEENPVGKTTTWDTSLETGRRSGEGREVTEWTEWTNGLEGTSGAGKPSEKKKYNSSVHLIKSHRKRIR